MRANPGKFVGIPCGSLKRETIPTAETLGPTGALIKWLAPADYTKLLGIPFWTSGSEDQFWKDLYNRIKTRLASWKKIGRLTATGRVNLANLIAYGIPRYWTQSMYPPKWFNRDLNSDVFQLLWTRDPTLEAAESGSGATRGWMKKICTHNPRKYNKHGRGLGLGLIHWESHLKAIRTKWILKYLDSTQGPWKLILDQWFAQFSPIERDHVLTAIPTEYLTEPIGTGTAALPKFWIQALDDARSLVYSNLYSPP